MQDLAIIEKHMKIERLPDDLRRIAEARLRDPEATLAEIGEAMDPEMSKSGVNHRFKKLHALAEKLRGV